MVINPEAKNARIRVENVSVNYGGTFALQNASLHVNGGSICALIGVNGAGKSTLFKAIMGFVTPTAGSVYIDGLPIRPAQKRGLVGYVPQAEEVDWAFPVSVWDVVLMGRYGFMNFMRIPSAHDKQVAEKALRRMDMWAYRDRQIGALSGGQRKRAFLARALAQEAKIMLMDEPFTGVDANTEQMVIQLLGELRDEGDTILISTHDLNSIESFCDHVAFVNKTVLAYGPIADVFTPDNLALAFGGVLRHLNRVQEPPPEPIRSLYNNAPSLISTMAAD
jgi:ABC-type Mn2+/Zn2+ transport system ATPase subunit